jgi:flagellar protein FlgJ
MLDNAGSDLGNDLLDQQFAQQMSGQPGGLSDLIAAQLTRQAKALGDATAAQQKAATTTDTTAPSATRSKGTRPPTAGQVEFVGKLSSIADKVEKETGIPASYMIGQAGHETAWGQHEIKNKGGSPSYNLFGIKATPGWTGKVAEVTTTEFVNGVAEKKVAKFRSYGSYEESFRDYAKLVGDSPRYAKVKAQGSTPQAFASGLQKAGYATDPEYAAKLSRAINTTLQLRRVQV